MASAHNTYVHVVLLGTHQWALNPGQNVDTANLAGVVGGQNNTVILAGEEPRVGSAVHGTVLDTAEGTTATDSVGVLGVDNDLGQEGLVVAGVLGGGGGEGRLRGEEKGAGGGELDVSVTRSQC